MGGSSVIAGGVIGNISDYHVGERMVERILLSWDEMEKRLLRKTSDHGTDIGVLLPKSGTLSDGDIIFVDQGRVIVVALQELEVIVIRVNTTQEMGQVCYMLGNRHLPLAIEDDEVVTPYDQVTWAWCKQEGFDIEKGRRKMSNVCKASGHRHG